MQSPSARFPRLRPTSGKTGCACGLIWAYRNLRSAMVIARNAIEEMDSALGSVDIEAGEKPRDKQGKVGGKSA